MKAFSQTPKHICSLISDQLKLRSHVDHKYVVYCSIKGDI